MMGADGIETVTPGQIDDAHVPGLFNRFLQRFIEVPGRSDLTHNS